MAVPHHVHGRPPLIRGRAPLVLVTFALMTTVVAAMVAVAATGQNFEARRSARHGEAAAIALSEAGIGAAVFNLRVGGNGTVGSEERPVRYGQGSYWVETRRPADEQYTLTAIGRVGQQLHRTVLHARFRKGAGTLELEAIARESAPVPQD